MAAVNDSTAEGKAIATFARRVLGKSRCRRHHDRRCRRLPPKPWRPNPSTATASCPPTPPGDEATKEVINDIIACLGADTDASGKNGVGQAKVDQFFKDAAAYSDWWKQAEGNTAILPLGLATPLAGAAVKAVKAKVDDYFARCRFAAFDPRAATP